jgi:hypothetical protein
MNVKFPDEAKFKLAGIYKGSRTFKFTAPFRYDSRIGWITVPAGFLTDGASIPRIFWSIFSPTGSYFEAAVIHDYLYSKASNWYIDRAMADTIFHDAMKEIGVGWLTRRTIHRAVRLGGWKGYKKSKLQEDFQEA